MKPELEDDVAEMVHHLIVSEMQAESTGNAKQQLREALEKMIDERIQAALPSANTVTPDTEKLEQRIDRDKTNRENGNGSPAKGRMAGGGEMSWWFTRYYLCLTGSNWRMFLSFDWRYSYYWFAYPAILFPRLKRGRHGGVFDWLCFNLSYWTPDYA